MLVASVRVPEEGVHVMIVVASAENGAFSTGRPGKGPVLLDTASCATSAIGRASNKPVQSMKCLVMGGRADFDMDEPALGGW